MVTKKQRILVATQWKFMIAHDNFAYLGSVAV